jgi:2-isopropylmalate synthase
MLSSIVGFDVQPNKAIVGRNAFAHEAGIHQHGVINNPLCYEIMTPESVGVPANSLVLGKHSGVTRSRLRYASWVTTSRRGARCAYKSLRSCRSKKRIYDRI